ncbi:MAG: hypothetical protein ACMVY4_09970 [Minwuia sp.]|uniref:hypothetical protein n=1 Tax=Minwuia sp. TaxID=2493630 RepID=UPI003A8A416A
MNFGALIDIVLGLVLLYLLLGLVCTVINEAIASFWKLRARNLRSRLEEIIDDPDLRKRIEGSGLIAGLAKASGGRIGPSYIPSRTMALSIVGALDPDTETVIDEKLKKVRGAIEALPDSKFKSALGELAADAGEDIQAFRENVAGWFDDMMERAGGVYKRWMKYWSLGVALAVTLALNADSIRIGEALWADEALRAQIADLSVTADPDAETSKALSGLRAQLSAFPLGWDTEPAASAEEGKSWITRIAGLLMTALAVSLGAPFWFDILRRVASMRSSGAPPARADGTDSGKA